MNTLSDRDYTTIRDLLFARTGVHLGPGKKPLICGRLFKRITALGVSSYGEYFAHLCSGQDPTELQTAIDSLLTNETYFFREPKHFSMLETLAASSTGTGFRVWSAACSSGEEVYTIAMVLSELERKGRCQDWEVCGSDFSTRVLAQAKRAIYRNDRLGGISADLLRRYFLRGEGPYDGTVMVEQNLRSKAAFAHINLIEPLPIMPAFNVIFLRNVLIYFELAEKRKIVGQLLKLLTQNGVIFVGLAETLNGVCEGLIQIGPGVYRWESNE